MAESSTTKLSPTGLKQNTYRGGELHDEVLGGLEEPDEGGDASTADQLLLHLGPLQDVQQQLQGRDLAVVCYRRLGNLADHRHAACSGNR